MTRGLRLSLAVTDGLFLAYWAVTALNALGAISLPQSLLFKDYHDARVVAWNWSFLPLDLAFSITGLWAIRAASAGSGLWRPLALISLLLTIVAGGMAVSYWAILLEFDPAWFLPNLALVIWPFWFLPGLVHDLAGA